LLNELSNEELPDRLSQFRSDSITRENALSRLDSFLRFGQNAATELEICRLHFSESIDKFSVELVQAILSYKSLQLEDENSLLVISCHNIERDDPFVILREYLRFA
jgi:hypothetical protein